MYRVICSGAATLCVALFILFVVNSGYYIATYGVAPDSGADFLGRRAAPLFLGLAIVLWACRDLDVGSARDGICLAMAVTWMGIAATGIYEWTIGTASFAILVAAFSEIVIGTLFLLARR
ncbi:hypothetical protein [Yoonia sp. SS1-5]|uniref:Uncharacterized protein n=1 Tax=Yoonia rhodophyticola TaxID=3137370 RepID=A0AAN0MJ98_9RHOB